MVKNEYVTLEEVLESLPHKFQKGKNVRIIFEAYLKQYNKILNSYVQSNLMFNIDKAVGDQLDRIGKNFLVSRGNDNDDDYRENIKLAWVVLKASGNVYNLNTIFLEYLGLDKDVISIYEKGNANIVLELSRDSPTPNIISAINSIIAFGKPVGVGFSIEPFTNVIILDTYQQSIFDMLIDRWNNRFMNDNLVMQNELHMYNTYYMNVSVDKYDDVEIEIL